MIKLKMKKGWFTLAETIIVCTIFAFIMVWIILAINRSFVFLDNTRILVRATNFAREWVEMVYNIRDSNWQKHAWARDKYRLSRLWAGWNDDNPTTSNIFQKWIYTINEWSLDGNPYVYATKISGINENDFYEIEWFFNANESKRNSAKITFTWTYKYFDSHMVWNLRYSSVEEWNMADILNVDGVEFYRILRVYGIYKKNVDANNSEITDLATLTDSTPKEMRFCVKVFFKSNWYHATELCSIMTNFEE